MNNWSASVGFLVLCLPAIAAAVLEPKVLVIVFCIYGSGLLADAGLDCIKEVHRNGKRR